MRLSLGSVLFWGTILLAAAPSRAQDETPPEALPAAVCIDEAQWTKGLQYAVVPMEQDANDYCADKKNLPDPAAKLKKDIDAAVKECEGRWKNHGPRFKTKIFPVFVTDRLKGDPKDSESQWMNICDKPLRFEVPGMDKHDWQTSSINDVTDDAARYVYRTNRETFAKKILQELAPSAAGDVTADSLKNVDPPSDLDEFSKLVPTTEVDGDFLSKELADQVKTMQGKLSNIKQGVTDAWKKGKEAADAAAAAKGGPNGTPQNNAQNTVGALKANCGAAFDGSTLPGCAPAGGGGAGAPGVPGGQGAAGQPPSGGGAAQADLSKPPPNKSWPQTDDEKKLSAELSKRYQAAFGNNMYGQQLNSMMVKDNVPYPPITIRTDHLLDGSINTKGMAGYDMEDKSININAYMVRKAYPETAKMSDAEIQSYFAKNPDKMDDLVKNSQGVMYHETMHSYQGGYCPLHGWYGAPKANFIEQETQAYGAEMRYTAELIKKDPSLINSKNPFMKNDVDNSFQYTMNPDKWRTGIEATYRQSFGANMSSVGAGEKSLDAQIAAAKAKCGGCDDSPELQKLRATRTEFDKADDFYKKQRQQEERDYAKNTDARAEYLMSIAKSTITTNPLQTLGGLFSVKNMVCGAKDDEWWTLNWTSPYCDTYSQATMNLSSQLKQSGQKLPPAMEATIVNGYHACQNATPQPGCAGGGKS
jgi:hypothetical protein